MQIMHPMRGQNRPQIRSGNTILKNIDQDKSFQKLLRFRFWLCLLGTLHLNVVCFTCDIYFGYSKETVKN